MAIITGCSGQQLKTSDQGVVINGVCWATHNVAAFGTFADKPEGKEWEKTNDPSHAGWRV